MSQRYMGNQGSNSGHTKSPELRATNARQTPILMNGIQLPFQLGQYLLVEKLGQGGMGIVYRAIHVTLKRPVAVKLLNTSRILDEAAVQRFLRESEMLAKLDHHNIIRAHDAGESNGLQFLAMEFVDGCDVEHVCRVLGPLPVTDSCEIVRQVAIGLQYAHSAKLIHRDIKPSNILLARNGQIKITDLGLARAITESKECNAISLPGQVVGTVDYLSPEQASGENAIDERSDLYSLGCALFRLLTGQAPFEGPGYESTVKKLHAHVHAQPPALHEIREDVPPALTEIVSRLLQKNPNQRIQSAHELADALNQFTQGSNLTHLASLVLNRADQSLTITPFNDGPTRSAVNHPMQVAPSAENTKLQSNSLRKWPFLFVFSLMVGVALVLQFARRKGSPESIESKDQKTTTAPIAVNHSTVSPSETSSEHPNNSIDLAAASSINNRTWQNLNPFAAEWKQRLGQLPTEIIYPGGQRGTSSYGFDEKQELFHATTDSIRLIQFGVLPSNFKGDISLELAPEISRQNAGLFFGYRV